MAKIMAIGFIKGNEILSVMQGSTLDGFSNKFSVDMQSTQQHHPDKLFLRLRQVFLHNCQTPGLQELVWPALLGFLLESWGLQWI